MVISVNVLLSVLWHWVETVKYPRDIGIRKHSCAFARALFRDAFLCALHTKQWAFMVDIGHFHISALDLWDISNPFGAVVHS